jgi:hypothetical protein
MGECADKFLGVSVLMKREWMEKGTYLRHNGRTLSKMESELIVRVLVGMAPAA